jgi:FdrA protein
MSIVVNEVRRNAYADSVALMRISRTIAAREGVIDAALMMGTPSNKQILRDAGLLSHEGENAGANDLILAMRAARSETAEAAVAQASELLSRPRASSGDESRASNARSLSGALQRASDASLALISVPGDYAAAEARKALRRGLDVMIFSDNVSVEDEVSLKREAGQLGRLVMGPDCGTAIINGVPLAFANNVARGNIGVIGASGTGIQEITTLIARHGFGISHAIGVGGRDLSQAVGGLTTLRAIDLLAVDSRTEHVVLVSKPPHPEIARAVLSRVAGVPKPFTICFLGAQSIDLPRNARLATTLAEAAAFATGQTIAGGGTTLAKAGRAGLILGLYSGGTLCAEAQLILLRLGRKVRSNAPVPGALESASTEDADLLIDLGADEYTRGRPHPMIDPAARLDQLARALDSRNAAVILLDVVIGYGAHPSPADGIVELVRRSREVRVVASVTGTEDDPQVRSRQVKILEDAGVTVATSNAKAAGIAAALASS